MPEPPSSRELRRAGHPVEGTLVAGKYRVEQTIGRGGMGVVLRAIHGPLAQPVALKVLSADARVSEEVVARFLREARAAAGLRSEFVARVTDYGALDDGCPFMAMELLEGEDLGAAIDRGLTTEEVVDAVLQACAGLSEAHAAGIVHRDLKPSNLFRTRRPDGSWCTKVLDFGISKVAERQDVPTPQTSTRSMLGTPLYMSPEQVRNAKAVDARTDVWSLGVVLYEALAGRAPFGGDTLGEVFAAILEQPPEPLAAGARRDVPPALERVVFACLAKSTTDRPRSMAELARLLEPFGSLEGRVAAQRAQTSAAAPGGRAVVLSDPGAETVDAAGAAVALTAAAPTRVPGRFAAAGVEPATPPRATLDGSVAPVARHAGRSAIVWIVGAGLVVAAASIALVRWAGRETPPAAAIATATHAAHDERPAPPSVAPVASATPIEASSSVPALPASSSAPSARPATSRPLRPPPPRASSTAPRPSGPPPATTAPPSARPPRPTLD